MCSCTSTRTPGPRAAASYYCVTQATPDLPLQVIVTGHYHDTFHRVDGVWWFDSRIDVRRPGRRRQPASEVLTGVAQRLRPRRGAGRRAAQGRRSPTGARGEFEEPLRVLLDDYAARRLNALGAHILRSGTRAQPADAAAGRGVVRRHPEILDEPIAAPIVVVGMMRSRARRCCSGCWPRPPPALRLRLGGGRARAPARTGTSPPTDPRIADREAREEQIARLRPGAVRHPPDVRPRGRGGDRLPGRRVPVAHPRGVVRRADVPVLARHPGLRAGLPLAAPDAAAPPVAEAAARASRARAVRAQDAGPPRLPRRAAGRVPRRPHRAHAPRPGRRDPVGRQSSTPRCGATHCDDVDPHEVGRAVARADGLDLRPGHGRPRRLDPRRGAGAPTSPSPTRWPIRSAQAARSTPSASTLTDDVGRAMRRWLDRGPQARDAAGPPLLGRRLRAHRRADPTSGSRSTTGDFVSSELPQDARCRRPGRDRRAARARDGRARADRAPGGRPAYREPSRETWLEKEQPSDGHARAASTGPSRR